MVVGIARDQPGHVVRIGGRPEPSRLVEGPSYCCVCWRMKEPMRPGPPAATIVSHMPKHMPVANHKTLDNIV